MSPLRTKMGSFSSVPGHICSILTSNKGECGAGTKCVPPITSTRTLSTHELLDTRRKVLHNFHHLQSQVKGRRHAFHNSPTPLSTLLHASAQEDDRSSYPTCSSIVMPRRTTYNSAHTRDYTNRPRTTSKNYKLLFLGARALTSSSGDMLRVSSLSRMYSGVCRKPSLCICFGAHSFILSENSCTC